MKISFLALAAALSAGAALPAMAAPVNANVGQTITTPFVQWFNIGNDCRGATPALCVGDAMYSPTGRGDAYDSALLFSLNGTGYRPDTADLTGTTYTGGFVTIGSFEVQQQYFFATSGPIARTYISIRNTSGTAQTANARWQTNVGSDFSTRVVASSTGDLAFTTADQWLVTEDGFSSDPTNGFVLFGDGTPGVTTASVSLTVEQEQSGTEGVLADYILSLAPGETVGLLFFNVLGDTPGGVSPILERLAAIDRDDPLLADLSNAQRNGIVNFFGKASPVPEPASFALLGLGLAAVGIARRRR